MQKQKEELFEFSGTILKTLPNAEFQVELENGHIVIGYTSGKMRKHRIKIVVGDKVKVEMSRYDKTRGRVVLRS